MPSGRICKRFQHTWRRLKDSCLWTRILPLDKKYYNLQDSTLSTVKVAVDAVDAIVKDVAWEDIRRQLNKGDTERPDSHGHAEAAEGPFPPVQIKALPVPKDQAPVQQKPMPVNLADALPQPVQVQPRPIPDAATLLSQVAQLQASI